MNREVYRSSEWPHGLRCATCDDLFTEGEAYSEELDSFQDDIPVVVLTCVPCELRGAVAEGGD